MLTGARSSAVSKTQSSSVAQAVYNTAQANANTLQRNADRMAKQLKDARGGGDVRKLRDDAANLRARATKLARHDGDKGEIKQLRDRADALSKEARAASKNSADRVKQLQKESDAAKRAADRGAAAASKSKDAWKAAQDAAQAASQAAADAAKSLVDALQQQADALAQSVSDFKDAAKQGLTAGTDLSTLLDKARVSATAANSTATRQGAEAAYRKAQGDLRAIQAKIATAGGTPADYAVLTAAQQAQTDALTKLTAAQDAESTAAAALADQQKTAAQDPVTAAQLQAQYAQALAQAKTFASDIQAVVAAGGNQDLVTQIIGLGTDAGDAMAKSLLASGKSGIAALQASMTAIGTVGTRSGDALAGAFYGKAEQDALTVIADMRKKFPAMAAALDAIAAPIKAAQTGQAAAKAAIPKFSTGVDDFRGGLALVHRDEALVNLAPHTSVVPATRARDMFDLTPVVRRLDELNARVDQLAPRIGDAMTEPMARYGQAHAQQTRRAVRAGG